MLVIETVNDEKLSVIEHSSCVFHEALKIGKDRIHVHNPGALDYDLVKIPNDKYRSQYSLHRWRDERFFYEYETYDENNLSLIYLPFLHRYNTVVIETAGEYSVVLARLFLLHTDAVIYYLDKRMEWFIDENDRFRYVEKEDSFPDCDVLRINKSENVEIMDRQFRSMGPIEAFQNVFFLQGTGIFDKEQIKYVDIIMDDKAGIGSILVNVSKFNQAFKSVGLRLVSRHEKLGRYPVEMLNDMFDYCLNINEANDNNTLSIPSVVPLITTWFVKQYIPEISKKILKDSFLESMKEYLEAIKRDRRVLGVLVRGTDYILVNGNNDRKMATAEMIIPIVDSWMKKYNYEVVFLATEDLDILNCFKEHFGHKMIVISQNRYSIKDMIGDKLLADIEKGEDEDNSILIDDTTNYVFALFILANCESFICSGLCNGYDLTVGINEGKFEHIGLFSKGEMIIQK